ncbi:MAG TPA: DNA mismatch repair protein MutS, partial [Verrucomicrobiae bacterium]|nr:DNA mismatch repair protein MutS [Verrucomicrobiae bacterium]
MAVAPDQTVKAEYQSRLAQWSRRAAEEEQAHRRMGNWRLLLAAGIVALAAALCRTGVGVGLSFVILALGMFLTGLLHNRVETAWRRARRAMGFYQAGLDRLDGTWAGKEAAALAGKSYGTEFLEPHHPFAADLDLFGAGSLFALLNTAQTEGGAATLAAWFLVPAAPEEIRARQGAVNELSPRLDLRERLGLIAAEAQGWIRTKALVHWAAQPRLLQSKIVRNGVFWLPIASLVFFLTGQWVLFLAASAGQFALARLSHRAVQKVVHDMGMAPRELERLADVLRCLESEPFKSERLRRMEAEGRGDGLSASQAIERLGKLHAWMESGNNLVFAAICRFFLWETQFAFALEAWRARFGPKVGMWLRRLAEFEALSSLAGYACEHPADLFPELLPAAEPARIEAEGLGHPLLPDSRCVRNDLVLGPQNRLIMISGSNMSGKSTWLRSIGVNLVLASAGATVRARKFRLTPVRIGASIRTTDSLQEGVSRFYAEVQRLGTIVKLAGDGTPLVFLLDEVLSGTNSHDRLIGASCVAQSLVRRGALGLMTTHDLALTRIVEEL